MRELSTESLQDQADSFRDYQAKGGTFQAWSRSKDLTIEDLQKLKKILALKQVPW